MVTLAALCKIASCFSYLLLAVGRHSVVFEKHFEIETGSFCFLAAGCHVKAATVLLDDVFDEVFLQGPDDEFAAFLAFKEAQKRRSTSSSPVVPSTCKSLCL